MRKLRKIIWIGSSRADLKGFPEEVQDEIGYALHEVQAGLYPNGAKPLRGFDVAVVEIISDFDTNTYRTIYTVKLGEYVYVLHVFQKKSKTGIKTPKKDVELIKQRLQIAKVHEKGEYHERTD